MKLDLSRNTRLASVALVLSIFLAYFLLNSDKFKPILDVNFYLLVVASLGYIGGVFANGLLIKFMLEPFRKYIAVSEAFFVSVVSSIGNFFAPAGTGFGIRAIYLKKKHGLAYSHFISTLSGNYVLVLLVTSIAGLGSLAALTDYYGAQWLVLFAVFSVMLIGSLLLSLSKLPFIERDSSKAQPQNSFIKNLVRVVEGWGKIRSNKNLMTKLLGLTFINLLFTIVIYWAIIYSLDLSITFPALLLISVLGTLTIFINITPANLGVKEAVYILSAGVLGFSVGEIVLIALVDRAVQFAVLLILWLFASRVHLKNRLAQ